MPSTKDPLDALHKEFDEIRRKHGDAITRVALRTWQVAVDATPKKPSEAPPAYQRTGRLAAGWKLNTGRNVGLIPAVGQYSSPQKPAFRFDPQKDRVVRLWNNIPYAYYVEHGLGRGHRTPRLMLKKATDYFESRIASEFNKI